MIRCRKVTEEIYEEVVHQAQLPRSLGQTFNNCRFYFQKDLSYVG